MFELSQGVSMKVNVPPPGTGSPAKGTALRVPCEKKPAPKSRSASKKKETCPASFMEAVSAERDRKSTRLNSSHQIISYAVFCLKKKKKTYYMDDNISAP